MGDTSCRECVGIWDDGWKSVPGLHKHSDMYKALGYGRSHMDVFRTHPGIVVVTLDHGELMMCSNGLNRKAVREVCSYFEGRYSRVVYSYVATDKPGGEDGDKIMGKEEFLKWLG